VNSIEVSWEIPPPEDYMLPSILLQHINLAAEGTPDDLVDQHDFASMFARLHNLLRTPRDCARIGNALVTTYPSVRGEVHFTDFVAIEVLRACVPRLHELIRTHPEQFTGIVESSLSQNSKKVLSEFHDRWLTDTTIIPEDLRTAVQDVATRLFPKLQNVWGARGYGLDFLKKWRGECRAASPEVLPTYFRLAVPSQSFSRQRTMAIVQPSSDFDALSNKLSNLLREKLPDGRTAISVFIERVTNLTEQIKLEGSDLINLLAAILNDQFIEVADSMVVVGFLINNSLRIIQLCRALLTPFEAGQRADFLKAALDKAPGLSAIVDLVSVLERQHEANRTTGFLVPESRCKELISIAENRISRAAEKGLLACAPQLAMVLGAWKRWNPDRAREWVVQFVTTDEGLLVLLETSTAEGVRTVLEDGVPEPYLTLNVEGLSDWIDLAAIRERLEALTIRSDIAARQRFAVSEILKFLDSGSSVGGTSEMSVAPTRPNDPDR
jgi:predicted KAP-like P-loop ATPase